MSGRWFRYHSSICFLILLGYLIVVKETAQDEEHSPRASKGLGMPWLPC